MPGAKAHTEVELVAVDSLIPYTDNPKEHPDEQVVKIADSIEEFGFTVPMVVDGKGQIIAGHGRYAAVTKHLDIDQVPVIERDDLTPEQVRAFRIADNRVAESAWDINLLGQEIEGLSFEDVDPNSLGFDDDELEAFLPDDITADIDPREEWAESGLAEYENEDLNAEYSIKVNFDSKEDLSNFADLVDATITEDTVSIWFPAQEKRDVENMAWENES